jgi:uncharacterized protein YuzE
MKIEYDSQSDALYIQLSKRKPDHVVDIAGNRWVRADVDKEGKVTGIEILFASGLVDGDLKQYDPDLKTAPSGKSRA